MGYQTIVIDGIWNRIQGTKDFYTVLRSNFFRRATNKVITISRYLITQQVEKVISCHWNLAFSCKHTISIYIIRHHVIYHYYFCHISLINSINDPLKNFIIVNVFVLGKKIGYWNHHECPYFTIYIYIYIKGELPQKLQQNMKRF